MCCSYDDLKFEQVLLKPGKVLLKIYSIKEDNYFPYLPAVTMKNQKATSLKTGNFHHILSNVFLYIGSNTTSLTSLEDSNNNKDCILLLMLLPPNEFMEIDLLLYKH